jgi:hypothetical protein
MGISNIDMTIKSKKNNLFNYFAHDHKDLSKQYIKDCEVFFKSIKKVDSKKSDKFVNCKSCNNYIYKDRSLTDGRYCQDCMEN